MKSESQLLREFKECGSHLCVCEVWFPSVRVRSCDAENSNYVTSHSLIKLHGVLSAIGFVL